jgi:BolA family transcriptional regulator, general stress-responsive regulator
MTSNVTQPTKVEDAIRSALVAALQPVALEIVNESHLHAGHRGSPGTGDSHFRVEIASAKFIGLRPVAQHRLVNDALAHLIGKPIHALALTTTAPKAADVSRT